MASMEKELKTPQKSHLTRYRARMRCLRENRLTCLTTHKEYNEAQTEPPGSPNQERESSSTSGSSTQPQADTSLLAHEHIEYISNVLDASEASKSCDECVQSEVLMHESSSEQPKGPQGQVDVVEENTWEGMRRPSTSLDEGSSGSKRRRQSERDRNYGTTKDKQFMSSDAQTENKLAAVTESSQSEESQILGKRKRKPIGQWWMSSTQSTDETKVPDNHLTHKRSKQHSKEPSTAEASPVKTKKVKVLKKINQKRPVTSTSQSTTKGKAKKTRQNKNSPAGGDAPNKMRVTDEVFPMDMELIEAQQHQPEEEEEVLDQDLDFGQSRPMFFRERDIIHNSGRQPSSVKGALSVSDLCAPPLKPLVLPPEDKADLKEIFKTLWPPTVDDDGKISPDHFDWYSYQDKVCGFMVDLNCSSICNGKLLLESYMKKPLWVDHSATTVFNILTSSVAVIIDGRMSHFHPGQAFMVESGHAYSIHNITAQPAVLYFTRILDDSSE